MAYNNKKNYKKRGNRKPRYWGRNRKSSSLAPKTANAVKAIVKSEMKQVIETKYIDNGTEPIPLSCLYHNTPYLLESDLLYSTQGITDSMALTSNRIGDSIFVKGVTMVLMLTNFSTRPNLVYRISVIKTKQGIVSGLGNPYGHPLVGNSIVAPIDRENRDLVSVVYDKTFTNVASGNQAGGDSDQKWIWRHYLPVNRKVKYVNGGSECASNSYRVYVTAYDTQGTFITTNVARFTWFRRVHFMDA